MQPAAALKFTGYQKFVVGVLAFLQFTIILDFMILSPLGAVLMPDLKITPAQFGSVVSAYAFSAGVSGLLAAGFADRFDRKKLLLFFYSGFVIGTLFCGLSHTFPMLLAARMFTGVFAGVIGSISFAIVTDLFPLEMRGRVMGVIQTAFSASQVMGIPLGLYFSDHWGWNAPFMMIVGVSLAIGILIFLKLQPIDEHLRTKVDTNPLHHLIDTVKRPAYLRGFMATALLATGGFMLMPFGSAFSVNNLGVPYGDLPIVYMITGIVSIAVGPYIGKLADSYGKMRLFTIGTVASMIIILFYTRLGRTPLFEVIAINVAMFASISARIISSSALISGIPDPKHRGSFMSVNSSMQQISGGFASALAGLIVSQRADGYIENFEKLGYCVIAAMVITWVMMQYANRDVQRTMGSGRPQSGGQRIADL
jgi:predicted MFS family arabinose efflux permease